MASQAFLIDAAASYGAGKALLQTHIALLRAGHHDAAVLLADLFVQIRDTATAEATKDVQVFIPKESIGEAA